VRRLVSTANAARAKNMNVSYVQTPASRHLIISEHNHCSTRSDVTKFALTLAGAERVIFRRNFPYFYIVFDNPARAAAALEQINMKEYLGSLSLLCDFCNQIMIENDDKMEWVEKNERACVSEKNKNKILRLSRKQVPIKLSDADCDGWQRLRIRNIIWVNILLLFLSLSLFLMGILFPSQKVVAHEIAQRKRAFAQNFLWTLEFFWWIWRLKTMIPHIKTAQRIATKLHLKDYFSFEQKFHCLHRKFSSFKYHQFSPYWAWFKSKRSYSE
jgi:hypothetical protein